MSMTTNAALLSTVTAKLSAYVEQGQAAAPAALAQIEAMRPTDTIIPASALTFSPTLDAILGEHERALHSNAVRQAAERAGVPHRFASELRDGSARERALLGHIFSERFAMSGDRVLVRSVGQEIRAILTDGFRRFDAWPIIESYAEGIAESGAVITDVQVSDLRFGLKAIKPEIIMVNGDPVVLGARLGASDFGKGTVEVAFFMLRLLCLNGMVGERAIRQVHLGKRIADDSMFSERTRALDTATMASAVRDVIGSQFSDAAMTTRKEKVERAAGTEIDPKAAFKELGKVLTKSETEKAQETFMFGAADVVPDGRNAWRLANALSFIAKSASNVDRAMDLERMAGAIVETPQFTGNLLDRILDEQDFIEAAIRHAA